MECHFEYRNSLYDGLSPVFIQPSSLRRAWKHVLPQRGVYCSNKRTAHPSLNIPAASRSCRGHDFRALGECWTAEDSGQGMAQMANAIDIESGTPCKTSVSLGWIEGVETPGNFEAQGDHVEKTSQTSAGLYSALSLDGLDSNSDLDRICCGDALLVGSDAEDISFLGLWYGEGEEVRS